MVEIHWLVAAFSICIFTTAGFICGGMMALNKDAEVYTEEDDAYWAEWVRTHNTIGRR